MVKKKLAEKKDWVVHASNDEDMDAREEMEVGCEIQRNQGSA